MSNTPVSKEKKMYMRIRNLCGLLGVVLPWLALFSAGIANHPSPQWWWSISATYYQSPALVAVLTPASIVLMTYEGYDFKDNLVTTLSGIFGLGIVLFPCHVNWVADDAAVGFFQIPVGISDILHVICAAAFFFLLAYNSFALFTKSGGQMTRRKQLRNRIYKVCGYGILCLMAAFVIVMRTSLPGYYIMVIEILLLHLFGLSWLVKGEAFPFLNDVEEPKA